MTVDEARYIISKARHGDPVPDEDMKNAVEALVSHVEKGWQQHGYPQQVRPRLALPRRVDFSASLWAGVDDGRLCCPQFELEVSDRGFIGVEAAGGKYCGLPDGRLDRLSVSDAHQLIAGLKWAIAKVEGR